MKGNGSNPQCLSVGGKDVGRLRSEDLISRYRTVIEIIRKKGGNPVGSVLSPLLFIIYINDLDEGITSDMSKFVVNTKARHLVETNQLNTEVVQQPHIIHRPLAAFKKELERYLKELGDRWVSVSGVVVDDDGSWNLQLVASWSRGTVKLIKPLWLHPIYDFKGNRIRIAYMEKVGIFETGDKKRIENAKGLIADVLNIGIKRLNMTASLVVTNGAGAMNPNGSWNGVVGVLARREADIGAMDFMPNEKRSQVMDFSISLGQDPVVIMSRAPLTLPTPFLLLQIFSLKVWLCLVATVLLGGGFLACITFLESRAAREDQHPESLTHSTFVFKILLFQSVKRLPRGSGGRIFAVLIMVLAISVGSIYTGSITAFLVIPFRSSPINSVSELLSSDMIPTVRSGTNTYISIVNDEHGALYKYRDRLLVLSDAEINSKDFLDKIAQGSHAVIDTGSGVLSRINMFTQRGEICRYHVSRESLQVTIDALGVRKNSRYLTQINYILTRLKDFGILPMMKKKYSKILCEVVRQQHGPKPLEIMQVEGPFIVLSVGLVAASVIYFAEMMCRRSPHFS
ncbi:probable glutamate receptor [Cherax quadricarinatus]|uniref:probable glutamate receptor n=1 Tax=Cherax quadricarinatus TaxID=27406 RepID=UPI00387E3648